ncbi:MAG: TonB-dependent receptor [Cytophagaceae bacterium]|nr:TonB-dependent receptor [Cytophagaceae bacterium]MDW8455411.1 TonB-dependent receptor [Cytophagaceae bacterium]
MKKIIVLALFSLLCAFDVTAQTGILRGVLVDKNINEPIPNSQVTLQNQSITTTSDAQGAFVLSGIPAGTYTLLITNTGYNDYLQEVTIADNQEVNLDTILIVPSVLLLKEVEVSSSIITGKKERETPTAVSTVTARDIEEKMGSAEFPEVLKSTPGVYTSMSGGALGAGRITVRGFGSEYTAVMINGIPVNDMENGRVYWSNWGGLNDVTRYKQVQRGLGASKLAISSVGGTINIITKPTEIRKGISSSYAITNSSYRHRAAFTASSGLINDSWAVTISGSRRWGEGFRPGTYADSWAYFISAYKKINSKNSLVFTGFGAPQETGLAYDATGEQYIKYGAFYNRQWGYHNGKKKNVAVNTFHKPQLMLNHYYNINEKISLTNSIYYSVGKGGSTAIQRTVGSVSLNTNDYFYDTNGILNWDTIYAINGSNLQVVDTTHVGRVVAYRSKYYLEKRHNNHKWYGGISSFRYDVNDRFSFTTGVDVRFYKGSHYATVEDLLGGDFFLDQDMFKNNADFNAQIPNRAVQKGDTVRYYYTSNVSWYGLFGQVEYKIRKVDVFFTGNLSQTSFFRTGKFQHEFYANNNLDGFGKSQTLRFTNFTTKGGINYRITGRMNVFFNAGYFNRAPFFTNVFVDARVSNQLINTIKNETIHSVEAGYSYRTPRITGNINAYYTVRDNWAFTESYLSNDLAGGNFANFLVSEVGAIHKGIEADVKLKLIRKLELSGMLNLGDWRWNGNAKAFVRNDATLGVIQEEQTIYIDRLPIGNAAQTIVGINARYQLPYFSWIGITMNHFDKLFIDYNPSYRVVEGNTEVLRLKPYQLFDLFMGKNIRIKKTGHSIRLMFNINNVLNNLYVIEGSEFPGLSNTHQYFYQFGRPRTYFLSLTHSF